jgi:hypothetical protein
MGSRQFRRLLQRQGELGDRQFRPPLHQVDIPQAVVSLCEIGRHVERPFELLDRLSEPPLDDIHIPEVQVCLFRGQVGRVCQCPLKHLDRLIVLRSLDIGRTEVIIGVGKFRIELDRLLE